jgi:hypothetical protein
LAIVCTDCLAGSRLGRENVERNRETNSGTHPEILDPVVSEVVSRPTPGLPGMQPQPMRWKLTWIFDDGIKSVFLDEALCMLAAPAHSDPRLNSLQHEDEEKRRRDQDVRGRGGH